MSLSRINVYDADGDADPADPPGYRARMNRFGPSIGAEKLGASIYDLPPGQSVCPYHYEIPEEEWLLVLTGVVSVRHPGGEEDVLPGEAVCFQAGPEGAHKVTNRGDEPVRVLIFSTRSSPTVAVYPDSNKVGIFDTGRSDVDLVFDRSTRRDYYYGEL